MIIDAHQHFWIFDPVRDAWIDESMSVIRRDFLPEHLDPILNSAGIDGCIAVQADQSDKETQFLLDLASKNDIVKKVVGWVDLSSADIDQKLEQLSEEKNLAGFRHILQAEPPEKMRNSDFRNGIRLLNKYGFTYDILIFPEHLEAAIEFVQAFPDQKFVIDHLAKPPIQKKEIEPWAKYIKKIASVSNVYCKLSGMVTEADIKNWKPADIEPYVDVVLEAFGPQRLMYGSDWPVCLLATEYHENYQMITEFISKLSVGEQKQILGLTAIEFYNIGQR